MIRQALVLEPDANVAGRATPGLVPLHNAVMHGHMTPSISRVPDPCEEEPKDPD
jgi:hypothetical protein